MLKDEGVRIEEEQSKPRKTTVCGVALRAERQDPGYHGLLLISVRQPSVLLSLSISRSRGDYCVLPKAAL